MAADIYDLLTSHIAGPNNKAAQRGSDRSGGQRRMDGCRSKAVFQTLNDMLRVKSRFRNALVARAT